MDHGPQPLCHLSIWFFSMVYSGKGVFIYFDKSIPVRRGTWSCFSLYYFLPKKISDGLRNDGEERCGD